MRERLGFWAGLAGFCLLLLLPAPDGMGADAWRVTALAFLMACWWMTEALPLTATALLPFALLPLLGVSTPSDVAASYYSPILRSEEHTSELQSLMRISYAVFCLKKKTKNIIIQHARSI